MTALLAETVVPRAAGTSAVLVGGPGDAPGFEATRHASILWLVDASGALLPLRGADATVVFTVILDGLGAAEVGPALDRFYQRDPFQVPRLFVSARFAADAARAHGPLLAQVRAWFERLQLDHRLVQRTGFNRQKNYLLNVSENLRRGVPAAWAGALRGLPAFVCGAGPSLDVSVPALAAVADQGVVFASDTALRSLARHGVQADFGVSMSSRKPPERCLPEGGGALPTRMAIAGVSPASWREAIPAERLCFLSRAHPTEQWIAGFDVPLSAVLVAENCGLTVLELAHFLGCAPIYLFGLDLALDATNPAAHHSRDADPALERNEIGDTAGLPRVPGNYTVELPTYLYSDWSALDARLATWPADLVFNVTDRGARLRNTRVVHPRQFALPPGGARKRAALAHLAAAHHELSESGRRALAALGAQGTIGCRAVPGLRAALAQGGAVALAAEFTRLFASVDFARALGSYTQKLLPHLAHPRPDDAFWTGLLDELEELSCLAEAVYGESVA